MTVTANRDTMTSKERWLAALDLQPVDRLPFWPKVGQSYIDAQKGKFAEMSWDELFDWLGADRHHRMPLEVKEIWGKSDLNVEQKDGYRKKTYRIGTHSIECEEQYDPASCSWHPMVFPINTVDDVRVMTEFYLNAQTSVEPDPEKIEEARKRYEDAGDSGVMTTGMGESPLMMFVEHLAGVANAHILLHENKDEVDTLFDAMHAALLRKVKAAAECTIADMCYLGENTSTTLISPAQYREYCARHIGDYAQVFKDAGKRLTLHMCGHLKALLPQLAQIPARAFEAFTTPTVGNATLLDGRTGCPDKCLIGGTNAALWLRPAREIIATIEKDLDSLPHHRGLVITSGGMQPPATSPETLREVCEWVKSYPVRP